MGQQPEAYQDHPRPAVSAHGHDTGHAGGAASDGSLLKLLALPAGRPSGGEQPPRPPAMERKRGSVARTAFMSPESTP